MLSESILTIVAQADIDRKLRAISGLEDGSTKVTLNYVSERLVAAIVSHEGRDHAVILGERECSCSCQDAYYRNATCRHQIASALFTLRVMQEEVTPPQPAGRMAA